MSTPHLPTRRFSRKRRNSRDLEKYESTRLPHLESTPFSPWRVETLLKDGAPTVSDWWIQNTDISNETNIQLRNDNKNKKEKKESNETVEETLSSSATFRNCGLSTWEKSREKWRMKTVQNRPLPPPSVDTNKVIAGLTQVQRTFELPGRMNLSDLVDLFVQIWECDDY